MSENSIFLIIFFNICIFHLFKKSLSEMSIETQLKSLKEFRIYLFKLRLFYRLNIFFCYKIVNRQILVKIYNKLVFFENSSLRKRGLVQVPFERTCYGCLRLSIFLPNFINNILKNSTNLNFNDFCNSLRNNILILYNFFVEISNF